MRNIMAAMTKQVETFLVHQRVRKDKTLVKQLLAKEYLERHRSDWYKKQINGVVELLESKEVKETEDYLALSLIYTELYHQLNATEINTRGESPLHRGDINLDLF